MHYTRETKVGIFVLAAFILFVCIGFQLGTFCISRHTHASYVLYFKDISGLLKKAEVKIAGVKVGWVEHIVLIEDDRMYARVDLLIDKLCCLYHDAYGLVRQEGILGPAYVELVPGTPTSGKLSHGAQLMKSHIEPISLDELLHTCNAIAEDVQTITQSCKQVLLDESIADRMQEFMHDVKQDLSYATGKIKEGFTWFDGLYFVYDGQVENMFQQAEHTCFKDSKGIFNIRIYTRADYFYLIGFTTSHKGYISRYTTFRDYTDNCLHEICPDASDLPDWARYQYLFNTNVQCIKRNAFKVDVQIGKVYKNIALRAGLIEGTGGVAADIFIPYKGKYGIISTLQANDFHGQNRISDDRPHLKWLTRFFVFNHVYVAFGVDDFVSKCNRSYFFGAGFRFGYDEMQWYMPDRCGC